MLLARLLVNSRLIVKFWGRQNLYVDFQLCRESAPLGPALLKGQLYLLVMLLLKNREKPALSYPKAGYRVETAYWPRTTICDLRKSGKGIWVPALEQSPSDQQWAAYRRGHPLWAYPSPCWRSSSRPGARTDQASRVPLWAASGSSAGTFRGIWQGMKSIESSLTLSVSLLAHLNKIRISLAWSREQRQLQGWWNLNH